MHNVLTEPLIRADIGGGAVARMSLPQVYEALVADEVEAFPALRPHQRHAWHAFLVQLGVLAIHKSMKKGGESDPPEDADAWGDLIRGLTIEGWPDDEPWQLVVDDITQTAFMQPPARSADKAKDYKPDATTPDGLDVLVTSKNHDLKMAIGSNAEVDDWVFALVSLQTMAGYEGSGKYGISRMNRGMGNRPGFSLAPSQRVGAHIRRDITALANGFIPKDAPSDAYSTLLWTRAWDGTAAEALPFDQLNLLYIEICRRIRLRRSDGGNLYAVRATSQKKGWRINAEALNGMTGDPWTPINRKDGKALTLRALRGGRGFTYERIVDYLTGEDWELPALCKATESERDSSDTMLLVARAMVRGRGKTEGYHERVIPVRKKMQTAMMRGAGDRDELGEIAEGRIKEVGQVQQVLGHAIRVLVTGKDSGKVSADHNERIDGWRNKLGEIVDRTFFDALQDELEADEGDRKGIRNRWLLNAENKDGVIDHARSILSQATESLPCSSIERYKARVNAMDLFDGRIKSRLRFLFDKQDHQDDGKGKGECQNNSEQIQEQKPLGTQLNLI